jgi:hypothetical protein
LWKLALNSIIIICKNILQYIHHVVGSFLREMDIFISRILESLGFREMSRQSFVSIFKNNHEAAVRPSGEEGERNFAEETERQQ